MTTLVRCFICDGGQYMTPQVVGDGIALDCPTCGDYWISNTARTMLARQDSENQPLLSHLVRRAFRPEHRVQVTSELLKRAFDPDANYPSAMEQVENLLVYLAENSPSPGELTDLTFERFRSVVGAPTRDGFIWVLRSAQQRGWLQGHESSALSEFGFLRASLTLSGWEWYESIGRRKQSRIAFMAMQYGAAGLDSLVNEHFRLAVAQAGFTLRRLDDEPQAGVIDNRLRVEIRRARLLICDLTHGNKGAYWEGGFAEGLGIPVIYTCEESAMKEPKLLHFDTRNSLIVPWTTEEPGKAAEMLKATIRNTLPNEAILEDRK